MEKKNLLTSGKEKEIRGCKLQFWNSFLKIESKISDTEMLNF